MAGGTAHRPWRFNGATAFRRWKPCRLTPRPANSQRRFNGATAFRRWKRWLLSSQPRTAKSRFNGATAFRRWKRGRQNGGPCNCPIASMGPPPFGDGNVEGSRRSVGAVMPLQWGHRLSAMETLRSYRTPDTPDPASMGPPPFGDGNHAEGPVDAPGVVASMGPPPFGDGNVVKLSAAVTTTLLQWGHRLSAMETVDTAATFSSGAKLQWGHRLSAMETSTYIGS